MSGQQVAAWVMLGLISAGLLALAIGIYYWKKQRLYKQHVASTSRMGHPTFEAMTSSELNRAGNVKHLMQAPERGRATSTGYDAPYGSSHMEVAEFQPQQSTTVPMPLKVDQQMSASADASLFENPYFADREFEFPKISHQSSHDVYADDSLEIDDSYIDGVQIKGITSTESKDHDDPRRVRPFMSSSSDFTTSSEMVLTDDDNLDMYMEGKLDISGITTGESSDDPKETSYTKRKISAGSLKNDDEMRKARNMKLQIGHSDPDNDHDLVIVTKSDLDNSDSPKGSSGELSPSFETIEAPSSMLPGDGNPFLDSLDFQDFVNEGGFPSQNLQARSQSLGGAAMFGLSNPLFVDTGARATQEVHSLSTSGAGAPISDTSLGSDISVIAMGKDDFGD